MSAHLPRDLGTRRKSAVCAWTLLVYALFAWPHPVIAAGPETVALGFVEHVQRGAIQKAKQLLEGPGYRTQPPGGDDAYFSYESGYEPNLAFLVGRGFVVGTPSVRQQRSDWYLIDGTIYAEVLIPLRFESDRPWLLPAPLAFGRSMDFIAFMNAVSAPAADLEHLTLRLRASVEPGRIKPPPRVAVPPPPVHPGAGVVVPQAARTETDGLLAGARPLDPGRVLLPSGEPLSAGQLVNFLPRLGGITVQASLIRWGRFSAWKLVRWEFVEPVLVTDKGEVAVGRGAARKR